jgi:hypothetical protein
MTVTARSGLPASDVDQSIVVFEAALLHPGFDDVGRITGGPGNAHHPLGDEGTKLRQVASYRNRFTVGRDLIVTVNPLAAGDELMGEVFWAVMYHHDAH